MELRTCGNPEKPAVLLLPDVGMDVSVFAGQLKSLESDYLLLLPDSVPSKAEEEVLSALEECIGEAFYGRLWGAYGLRAGGTLLLQLLDRGNISVRTAVVEGQTELPGGQLKSFSGQLHYWKGQKDKKAEKDCDAVRSAAPNMKTLTFKKKKAANPFISVRPDMMADRLTRAFGKAKVVRVTTVMDRNVDPLWRSANRSPVGKGMGLLKDAKPIRYDDENHTRIIEGTGGRLSLWSHRTILSPMDKETTVCTDRTEIEAGPLTPLVGLGAAMYFKLQQKKLLRDSKK